MLRLSPGEQFTIVSCKMKYNKVTMEEKGPCPEYSILEHEGIHIDLREII